jgi:hypothetical protein
LRWTALAVDSSHSAHSERHRKKSDSQDERPPTAPGAQAALDRIDIAQETRDRLAELVTPGSSLIVSDHGLSKETGKGTDFIVVTVAGGKGDPGAGRGPSSSRLIADRRSRSDDDWGSSSYSRWRSRGWEWD